MAVTNDLCQFLEHKALQIRIDSVRATTQAGSGHPTSCLSAADLVAAMYFHALAYDLENPKNPCNDRFILSKGHAIPVVYAALKQLGVISDEELLSLRKFDSQLEGHPTPRFKYNEAATGSLGQGLSVGLGMALSAKLEKYRFKTYVMLGDGELAEGSVWEAAELAAAYKVDNLVGIIDCNRLAQSGAALHKHKVERWAKKFEAFGWETITIDGHDMNQILDAYKQARAVTEKPCMIIAQTFKGHGLPSIQDKNGFHGKPIKKDNLDAIIQELNITFDSASKYAGNFTFEMRLPKDMERCSEQKPKPTIQLDLSSDVNKNLFEEDQEISTRKAFGYALAALGRASENIVALDADVKNSTFTEIFEKEFPERFIQCFIAEQNMVGVAAGLDARGKIPFAATFGAFFARAHDQIRMAGIGKRALRLSGSHCGVSIGEDGPSQMALEDIAMMRSIPQSVVLYPSDGVSTYKLVEQMAWYKDGVSYLRTTRMNTPILYGKHERFMIGGSKVLRRSGNDAVCIIAAGITVHEALKAHQALWAKDIPTSVIDMYSIKPLDVSTILDVVKESNNKVITVEDHYLQGGLGEAVSGALVNAGVTLQMMGVNGLSRSGPPEELMKFAGIDSESIIKAVELMQR